MGRLPTTQRRSWPQPDKGLRRRSRFIKYAWFYRYDFRNRSRILQMIRANGRAAAKDRHEAGSRTGALSRCALGAPQFAHAVFNIGH